jgi:serine O-acetyltransferase
MGFKELKYYIYADFHRTYGAMSKKLLAKTLLGLTTNGLKYMILCRLLTYLKSNNKMTVYKILNRKLTRYKIKYGIDISPETEIGEGLSIPHCGNIVLGGGTKIGKNCTMLQGTTIGSNLFKSRYELAVIGDNVLIGSGAKIIGPIKIGHNVTIGANSVVTKDIPDDVVIAGNPAKIISHKRAIEINCNYLTKEEFINKN